MTASVDPFDNVDGDEDFEFEDAAENPALTNAAVALAQSEAAPTLPDPLDGPVRLPGGFRRLSPGQPVEEVTTAVVRELNGEDEERIAKARLRGTPIDYFDAILSGGVERLGKKEPSLDELRGLSSGDRDFLLLEISRATYGNELDYVDVVCYHCGGKVSFTVHKDEDIPVRTWDGTTRIPETFVVRLKNDRTATVRLMTGAEQAEFTEAETPAEVNTIIIAYCVEEISGPKGTVTVAGDLSIARKLGVADREKIVTEMSKVMPGPQYNEVRFTHPDCGNEVQFEVTHADLFRTL